MSAYEGRIGSAVSSHLIGSGDSVGAQAVHGVDVMPAAAGSTLETLDEPVSRTILRDVRRVAIKLKHVLVPKDTVKELRDCSWGSTGSEAAA